MDEVKSIVLELPSDKKVSRFAEGGLYVDGKLLPVRSLELQIDPDDQVLYVGISLNRVTILSVESE